MERLSRLAEKALDALISLRAGALAAGIFMLLWRKELGLDDQTAAYLTGIIITWIAGDTVRPTSPPKE